MKFSHIFGLSFLFASAINARSIDALSNDDKANDDKYYLCYIKNEHGEYKVFSDGKKQKREDSEIFVDSIIDEINTLIVDNKDTYQNPEKLEEIEENAKLQKRGQLYNYNDGSDFVYPISSISNRVVLYTYLSKVLVEKITSQVDKVIECTPDEAVFKYFHKNYNVDEILAETKWKNLSVRENADQHLSLISQGKVNLKSGKYDTNYYYPSSAGKDVDLVFLDGSFNFGYSEFSNNERTAKCVGIVRSGRVSNNVSSGCAIDTEAYHGESTSVTAAGLKHGVASRANVYGIAVPTTKDGHFTNADILGGVQYIYENMIRPYKTVINFSLGGPGQRNTQYFRQFNQLITSITNKGGIVVAAAGNEGQDLDTYPYDTIPCELDDSICVGGIDNDKKRSSDIYSLVYFSNFGKNVDVYAPSNVKVEIIKNNRVVKEDTNGTSFSCPLVAGLIATIIGENPEIKYTRNSILNKLYENGKNQTFTVKRGLTGILANNGKRIVYSGDSINQRTTTTARPRTTTTSKSSPTNTNNNECYGKALGYSCCSSCSVYTYYTDSEGHYWGYGSVLDYYLGNVCSIKYSCL